VTRVLQAAQRRSGTLTFDHKVLAAACHHPFAASCVATCNVTLFQGHLQHAQAATGPGSPASSQALCLKHSCVHSPLTLRLAASYQLLSASHPSKSIDTCAGCLLTYRTRAGPGSRAHVPLAFIKHI